MKSNKKLNALIFILILVAGILFIISKYNFAVDKLGGIVQNRRLKTITKNMETKKIDNITYYYSNKSDETHINNIKQHIKEGEVKTAPLLGQATMYPFNIIMFTTSEAFGKVFKVNPEESQAVTIFNSIYVPCDNINPYVFVHEYTHYKMHSFCKQKGILISKIPIWFSEGVAEYASSPLFPDKFTNPKIQNIQDFRKLGKLKQMLEGENKEQSSYMQSYIAVKKIIELKGKGSIQEILINTKTMTFYNSFEKVVGLSIDDFQKSMENQLKSADEVDALIKLGWKYSQQKKFDKAKDTFLEATKKCPDNNLAWLNLGHAYIDLGDFDSAIKAREKLISVNEKKNLAYFYYSQLLISTDLDKAVAMAEKAAQLAKIEKAESPKFSMNYFLLIKDLRDNIDLDKPFTKYVTLIESDYISGDMLKIDIINHVLAKYPGKSDKQKEKLIKLKSDLEKQK